LYYLGVAEECRSEFERMTIVLSCDRRIVLTGDEGIILVQIKTERSELVCIVLSLYVAHPEH